MLSIPMSEAQFAAASARLRAQGVEVTGPSGVLVRDGITARYAYTAEVLTVEITDHPLFFPVSLIEARLESFFQSAAG